MKPIAARCAVAAPRQRRIAYLAAAALLAFAFSAPTGAAEWGQMDSITFSRAVALPGVVLPAGSYTFEIANPQSSLTLVRVTQNNTHRVHFAGFTQRVARPDNLPSGQFVTFGEAPAGEAIPITVWYPAAGARGHRFEYQ